MVRVAKRKCTGEELQTYLEHGFTEGVRGVVRSKRNGEPRAHHIDHVYKEPKQMAFEDWVKLARSKAAAGRSYYDLVAVHARECREHTGRGSIRGA